MNLYNQNKHFSSRLSQRKCNYFRHLVPEKSRKMATASENSGPEKAWVEFCERHAIAAAQDFSKSCHNYINMCLPENARSLVNHKDLLKKFLEYFSDEFDRDFNRRRLGGNKCLNGVSSSTTEDSFDTEDGSPKMSHKPFFRR